MKFCRTGVNCEGGFVVSGLFDRYRRACDWDLDIDLWVLGRRRDG